MSAGRYNLFLEQGATFDRTFTWSTQSGGTVDLSGYTARLKIRDGEGTQVVSLTTTPSGNGDVITLGGTAGTIDVYISDESTAAMRFASGRWDLELVDTAGRVTRLLAGIVQLSNEVTS